MYILKAESGQTAAVGVAQVPREKAESKKKYLRAVVGEVQEK